MDWNHVKDLQGKTLRTTVQRKEFTVASVDDAYVYVVPADGKRMMRPIPRKELERLLALGLQRAETTPQRVREEFPSSQNTSYLSAILQAIL